MGSTQPSPTRPAAVTNRSADPPESAAAVRIAIAGAGIAGLAASVALAERGFSVDIYERAATLEEMGAGIQLSPNAMAVLESLGVAAHLAGRLVEPRGLEIREAKQGRLLTRIPLGDAARRRYGAPYALIQRADLHAGLLAAARRQVRVAIRLGAPVKDITTDDGGVSFRAGPESLSADLLVAADGVRSDIRTGFFGHPGAEESGHIAWRATLARADIPEGISRDSTGLWLGPGAHLVHYPVHGGAKLNLVVIAEASEPSPTPPVERFGAAAGALLAVIPDWTFWRVLTVDATRQWTRGPVALIGDSAHAMVPSAAQGGAQAIEDAWVLAEALHAQPADPARALVAFERVRRARVERTVREAGRNLTIYHLGGLSAVLRNAAISLLPRPLHIARLDWIYGWKPTRIA